MKRRCVICRRVLRDIGPKATVCGPARRSPCFKARDRQQHFAAYQARAEHYRQTRRQTAARLKALRGPIIRSCVVCGHPFEANTNRKVCRRSSCLQALRHATQRRHANTSAKRIRNEAAAYRRIMAMVTS